MRQSRDARVKARQDVADRLGWPAGALEICFEIEREYPEWAVFWVGGDEPRYVASMLSPTGVCELRATTSEALREQLQAAVVRQL